MCLQAPLRNNACIKGGKTPHSNTPSWLH